MILIAGGAADPNLDALHRRAAQRDIAVTGLRVGARCSPRITWDLSADTLLFDGEPVRPSAMFLRGDVFEYLADGRATTAFRADAWHTAVVGWGQAHASVRLLNRASAFQLTNKPYVLCVARRCGLSIPPTLVTNDLGMLDEAGSEALVVKPVNGGGYCQQLAPLLVSTPRRGEAGAAPAIVQQRLNAPDVRVFFVAGRVIAFRIDSPELDYRADSAPRIELAQDVATEVERGLRHLLSELQLDFAAADFKTCPRSGALSFLEVNNSPMFAAFDRVSEGAISDAILDFLVPC